MTAPDLQTTSMEHAQHARDPATVDDWRWQHAHAATNLDQVEELFPGRFDLSGSNKSLNRVGIAQAISLYGMRVTPYYLSLARKAREDDPVWALAVPSPHETRRLPEELDDPIGDEADGLHPHPALTRRYIDRVLLYPTPICSVHCRHCFRKRLVGRAAYAVTEHELHRAIDWIAEQPELHEVILTGGDPLTLSDERLMALMQRLDAIPHIWSLRLHTRMPVVNPFRITDELVEQLATLKTPRVVVTHVNHAVEVTPQLNRAVQRLRSAGIDCLNQSVLLKGLNDSADVHRELLWSLLRAGVRPYALHHADLVPGTSHLRTSVATGQALMRALRGTIPGHALPRYLLDVPGGHGKVPLERSWVTAKPGAGLQIETLDGATQRYPGQAETSPGFGT
ncbi:MAG: KamA family radical SAM protein [Planctomycetota bacterium]|nr:KamA family radical SAM protein [Planctomycetota bacterium]